MAKKNTQQPQEQFKTMIGGQALIEGIMMLGPEKSAVVVRTKDGLQRKGEPRKLSQKWSPKKLPFIQSHASLPVMLLTMLGIAVVTLLPFTPLAAPLGLCALPPVYFVYLALIVLGYMVLATLMKKLYIRKYHELL